jgi:putative CocE/NonD family hydrolase
LWTRPFSEFDGDLRPLRRARGAEPVPSTRTKPGVKEEVQTEFVWNVRIPLRDGVKLSATLYKPREMKKPLPVIFTLTPYTADTYHERGVYFSKNGYVFALVDCRGRGNSEGEFKPFENEGRDGHDIVEWLARQSWSNGKVAMWGGSYAGFDQWSTLKEFPPHLKTIVPAASAHPAVDFPFFKNICFSYDMQWLTLTSGLTANMAVWGDNKFWIEKFREHYLKHLPFRDLDKTVGNMSTVFHNLVTEHHTPDAYLSAMVPNQKDYARMDVPILTITGHYDGDQPGALEHYRQHMKYGSKSAKNDHYLVIGPWDHPGTRTPKKEVGGLTFGEASLVDLNKLHREWYDWTMKSGPKPAFLKERVAYYVTGSGAEAWKYADSFEAISNTKLKLHLQSAGISAGDSFHSGVLTKEKPGKQPPDHYVYDPMDVRPAEIERDEVKNFLTDQRYALNFPGAGVAYHTDPFSDATEISGSPKLVVWMSIDVPDTDFWVRLYEIMIDGSSVFLTEDLLRARYRESPTKPVLVKPGEVNRYEFNDFYFFSRRIAKGSRLRLTLTSPNSIFLEKNYNSGGVKGEESGREAREANVKIYHDLTRPSLLELPVPE